ncbi:hypothetical protein DBR43_04625 [Pedobacter sp. KBW06]|uniref:hypothetical protein n=1 Tax=Pedobacter sp. KBW06 TaxID=2153359 RepID=UPI000F59C9D5|nr:hypothetical protein [Pedobacter sp. KBW06]RQO74674.1 hypothetical protein DBR43_04625 [Pedobacter sp. KBW06]
MKQQHLFSIFLLCITLLFACKKDKSTEERIDYNTLTEKRIIEVSEQEIIKDEDLPPLERLLEKVTQKETKDKLTLLLADVKQVKEILPAMVQLRTNPEIDFEGKYKEIQALLNQISNGLPRKARLQKDLEDAKGSYNTEEVEFDNTKIPGSEPFVDYITKFLEKTYKIKPIAGKPNRFLRSDIEKVDSLASPMTLLNNIKKFKGLKYLSVAIVQGPADFNSLIHLETVKIGCDQEVKIDQLQKLKHLEISQSSQVSWDFSGKTPLLESLTIGEGLSNKITTLLLPNQKNLKSLHIGTYLNPPKKLTRLVVTGNGNTSVSGLLFESELEELRLSGITGMLGINGNRPNNAPLKIKNFELTASPNIERLDIGGLDLPKAPDLSQFTKLKIITIRPISISSKELELNELLSLMNLKNQQPSLEQFSADFIRISNGSLDLGKFSKLKTVTISSNTQAPLRKLILNRAISKMVDPGDGSCDDCGGIYLDGNAEIIFTD